MRVRSTLATCGALLATAGLAGAGLAGADGGGGDPTTSAKKVCTYVNGKSVCLKVGDRCRKQFAQDYLVAGFECRRRKLVKASEAALRGDQVAYLGEDGEPSFKTALQAFDKLVADLPGVKQRPGVIGESDDGTIALEWMRPYVDRLNHDQRVVFDSFLNGDGTRVIDVPPSPGRVQSQPRGAIVQEYVNLISEARMRLRAHGFRFEHELRLLVATDPPPTTPAGGTAALTANAGWRWGVSNTCDIRLYPGGMNATPDDRVFFAFHEVVHCAQGEILTPLGSQARAPTWLIEGFANWAAAQMMIEPGSRGSISQGLKDWWSVWFSQPQTDLFARSYDAIGFWALLQHQGVDPWAQAEHITSLGGAGGPLVAYIGATQGLPNWTGEWGPALANLPDWGRLWSLEAPGVEPGIYHQTTVTNSSSYGRTVESRGAWAVLLNIQADIIELEPTPLVQGYVRLPGMHDLELAEGRFCTVPGGCVCEDGTDLEIPQIQKGNGLLGYSGVAAMSTVYVEGSSLKSHCKKKDQGSPPEFKPGLAVYELTEDGPGETLTSFKSGSCSKGGGFKASSTAGAYHLDAKIENFRGFDEIYGVDYSGDSNASFEITGPGGPFANKYLPPDADGPPGSGVMLFNPSGKLFGIGMYPVFNESFTRAVVLLGAMKCKYPKK